MQHNPEEEPAMLRARIVIVLFALVGSGAFLNRTCLAEEPVAPFVETVQVHAGLPPFEVRILPLPLPGSVDLQNQVHPVAHVEIYRRGESKPLQTLEVTGHGSPFRLQFSRFEDANFDGYTDLLLGQDGGAKWTGYEIYFYDPASGSFLQNGLSREMSESLRGNDLRFDRATGTIELNLLVFGCQGIPMTETFDIQGSHLRQIRQVDAVREKDGCYEVTKSLLPDGTWKELSRKRAHHLDEE
jgi:hypothetical protein